MRKSAFYIHRGRGTPKIFKPIDNKKNFELIIGQISDLMIEGRLKPGDRMIPERELAQILNVSRSSLREAFKVLEVMDLLEMKPREGTFLKEPSISSLMKLLPMMLLVKNNEPHKELYEIRICFETFAAKLAAERRTEAQLQQMEKHLKVLRTSHHVEELIQADINFHRSITEATGNSLMIAVMEVIAGLMQYSVEYFKTTHLERDPNYNAIASLQHDEIYEAIKAKDVKLAEDKMIVHFEYSYIKLLQD